MQQERKKNLKLINAPSMHAKALPIQDTSTFYLYKYKIQVQSTLTDFITLLLIFFF